MHIVVNISYVYAVFQSRRLKVVHFVCGIYLVNDAVVLISTLSRKCIYILSNNWYDKFGNRENCYILYNQWFYVSSRRTNLEVEENGLDESITVTGDSGAHLHPNHYPNNISSSDSPGQGEVGKTSVAFSKQLIKLTLSFDLRERVSKKKRKN